MNYTGSIIEESLEDKSILGRLKITSTEIEEVTERTGTPWLKHWTVHDIEIPENEAAKTAIEISKALDSDRHNWYADYQNDSYHYIIFRNKVFFIDRTKIEQYREARNYGISLGVPEHQVNFEKKVVGEGVISPTL